MCSYHYPHLISVLRGPVPLSPSLNSPQHTKPGAWPPQLLAPGSQLPPSQVPPRVSEVNSGLATLLPSKGPGRGLPEVTFPFLTTADSGILNPTFKGRESDAETRGTLRGKWLHSPPVIGSQAQAKLQTCPATGHSPERPAEGGALRGSSAQLRLPGIAGRASGTHHHPPLPQGRQPSSYRAGPSPLLSLAVLTPPAGEPEKAACRPSPPPALPTPCPEPASFLLSLQTLLHPSSPTLLPKHPSSPCSATLSWGRPQSRGRSKRCGRRLVWRCRLFRRLGAFPGSRELGAREARVERPAQTEEGPCLSREGHRPPARTPSHCRGRRSPE